MKILSTIIKIANKIADTYLQRWNYLKLHSYGSQVALGGGCPKTLKQQPCDI